MNIKHISKPEYCVCCPKRKGHTQNKTVYGKPLTHYKQDGCHNCRYLYVLYHWEGGHETFCHRDGSFRPLNGEHHEYPGEACRVFFDDITHCEYNFHYDDLWLNAIGMHADAWDVWATAHKVKESDMCHEWKMNLDEIIQRYDNKFESRTEILTDEFLIFLRNEGILLIKDLCTEDLQLMGALDDIMPICQNNIQPIYLNRKGFVPNHVFDAKILDFVPAPKEWIDSAIELKPGFLIEDESIWTIIHCKGEPNFGLMYLEDLPEAPPGFITIEESIEIWQEIIRSQK